MTVTALATPADEPPEWYARLQRHETGDQHAPWCPTLAVCGGECTTRFRVGPLTAEVVLRHGAPGPEVILSNPDGSGVVIPDGVVKELSLRMGQFPVNVPPPWLRKQPS